MGVAMKTSLFPPTFAEALTCVHREIKMRRHVYPNRVFTKRMSQAKMDQEIETMELVARVLERMGEEQFDQHR